MRALLSIIVLLALVSTARAETVRVVIAKGAVLEVVGEQLELRGTTGDWVSAGKSETVRLRDSLVATDAVSAKRVRIRDASGAVVRVDGRAVLGHVELLVVNGVMAAVDEVELETYVASVLGAEMPSSWPAAALEAQAVAARTYALSRKQAAGNAPWHLEATVSDQVYGGTSSLALSTVFAAQATTGLVLTYEGRLAEAYFFSNCVGKTESAQAAFGQAIAYLVPVSCKGGEKAPNASWTRRIEVAKLSKELLKTGALGDALKSISIVARTDTGRVRKARFETKHGGERVVPGSLLRQLVGYRALPSLDVDVRTRDGELVFTGRGSGHGVGLCQWCARGQADSGRAAKEILAHFYPGTTLQPLAAKVAGAP